MKKKILRIAAFALAIVLIAGVCVFADSLVGNPISKALAARTAKRHLEENYADEDFEIERVAFSFKDGNYHAFVYSPSSMDSTFSIGMDRWGRLRYDSYEDRVLSGENTADRIGRTYRKAADAILDSQAFPYDTHIAFGDLKFCPREQFEEDAESFYALDPRDLVPDAIYNVNELGARHGKLTIYIEDDTVSHEKLSEILLEIRRLFDHAGVNFYVIDCVLEYPKEEDGTKKEGRVEVREFLYTDIYEEGMAERVKASDEAARAYYAEMDAEKRKEEAEVNH